MMSATSPKALACLICVVLLFRIASQILAILFLQNICSLTKSTIWGEIVDGILEILDLTKVWDSLLILFILLL